jgi:phosphoribosylformylglycinamidine cyclo-ligase
VYIGPNKMTDAVEVAGYGKRDVGHLLLSPTRTYAPLLKVLLNEYFYDIHGLVHNSGGGQTKCLKYLPAPLKIIKDNLFEPPVVFDLLKLASGSDWREMYQVFNMGHRLDLFTNEASAEKMIQAGKAFGIETKIIGRVEAGEKKELLLKCPDDTYVHY